MGSKHTKPEGHDKKYGTKCEFLHDLTLLKLKSTPDLHTLSENEIYDLYCKTYESFKTAVKEKESCCEHAHKTDK